MYAKTIKYTDFNGVERDEIFNFNLTKFELTELQVGVNNKGFAEELQSFVDNNNSRGILMSIKDIILKSYGEKDETGKYFLKKDADGRLLCNMFEQTEAFSTLYMELLNDDEKATEFILGIIPADMAKEVALQIKANKTKDAAPTATKTSKSAK